MIELKKIALPLLGYAAFAAGMLTAAMICGLTREVPEKEQEKKKT
jgi:hypothetical protein